MTGRGFATLLAVALVGSCRESEVRESVPPAHVEHPAVETELNRVTLTPEAVARLGIETSEIRTRAIPAARDYGGDVTVPAGQSLTVSSPIAGLVVGQPPPPGVFLEAGGELFRLAPLAPETDPFRLESEAAARLELARIELQRAEQLLADRAGSERRLQEAQAALRVAEATYRSVGDQLESLRASGLTPATEGAGYAVASPIDGRLARVLVADGQSVAPTAPLFEVFAEDPLWVRVPVYAGELDAIDRDAPARLKPLGAATAAELLEIDPAEAPPVADPNAVSVDLYYRLPNRDRRFQPGQKVSVTLRLTSSDEALAVAASAILYDIDGGTWVYENPSPGVFQRRRVEVDRVVGDLALLRRAPPEGTPVVTVGAAELFGTEFGVGH